MALFKIWGWSALMPRKEGSSEVPLYALNR